jgi:hypothetical protein
MVFYSSRMHATRLSRKMRGMGLEPWTGELSIFRVILQPLPRACLDADSWFWSLIFSFERLDEGVSVRQYCWRSAKKVGTGPPRVLAVRGEPGVDHGARKRDAGNISSGWRISGNHWKNKGVGSVSPLFGDQVAPFRVCSPSIHGFWLDSYAWVVKKDVIFYVPARGGTFSFRAGMGLADQRFPFWPPTRHCQSLSGAFTAISGERAEARYKGRIVFQVQYMQQVNISRNVKRSRSWK